MLSSGFFCRDPHQRPQFSELIELLQAVMDIPRVDGETGDAPSG